MEAKTEELLKVLDLRDEPQTPEEIQFQWTPLKVWASKHLFDDPDERNAFYKGYISLADLAFRLSNGKIAGKKPIEHIIDVLIKNLDSETE